MAFPNIQVPRFGQRQAPPIPIEQLMELERQRIAQITAGMSQPRPMLQPRSAEPPSSSGDRAADFVAAKHAGPLSQGGPSMFDGVPGAAQTPTMFNQLPQQQGAPIWTPPPEQTGMQKTFGVLSAVTSDLADMHHWDGRRGSAMAEWSAQQRAQQEDTQQRRALLPVIQGVMGQFGSMGPDIARFVMNSRDPGAALQSVQAMLPKRPSFSETPQRAVGPDGKPQFVQFSETGEPNWTGIAPYEQPDKPEKPDFRPTRVIERNGRKVTFELQDDGTEKEIATSPAWEPNNPQQPPVPTIARDFLLPLLQKIQSGQQLTPSEQNALDTYQRTGMLDRILAGGMGGMGLPMPPPLQGGAGGAPPALPPLPPAQGGAPRVPPATPPSPRPPANAAPAGAIPTITSAAEHARLKPGEPYIYQGKQYTKGQ